MCPLMDHLCCVLALEVSESVVFRVSRVESSLECFRSK